MRRWQAGLALHLTPVGRPAGRNCSPSSSLCFPASVGTPSDVDVLPQAGEQIGADPRTQPCATWAPSRQSASSLSVGSAWSLQHAVRGFRRLHSGGKESPFAGLARGRGRAGVLAACCACVVGVPCAWRAAILHLLPGCVGTGRPGRVVPQPCALTVQLSCHPIKMGCVARLPSECHRSAGGSSGEARVPGPPVPAT